MYSHDICRRCLYVCTFVCSFREKNELNMIVHVASQMWQADADMTILFTNFSHVR